MCLTPILCRNVTVCAFRGCLTNRSLNFLCVRHFQRKMNANGPNQCAPNQGRRCVKTWRRSLVGSSVTVPTGTKPIVMACVMVSKSVLTKARLVIIITQVQIFTSSHWLKRVTWYTLSHTANTKPLPTFSVGESVLMSLFSFALLVDAFIGRNNSAR